MPLARQLTNVGARGQDARYDIAGLPEVRPGVYSDGVYEYDSRGLDLSGRKAERIPGLRGADENFVDGQVSYAAGGGGGGGIPGGAIIAQQLALAKKAYETALAKITNQRQSLSRESGFTFDVDPTSGVMNSMRVDPHSIYGTFQLLNRQQAQRDEDARAVAIERGLGAGGGLAAQLRSNAKYKSGQEDAQFASTLTDRMTDLAFQQQEAKQTYDAAKYQAELEQARLAALSNYGGGGGGGGGGDSSDDGGFIFNDDGTLDNTGLDYNAARSEHLDMMRRRAMPRPRPQPVKTNYNPKLPMGIQRVV